ncbi:nickel-dependent hydrogenase large subunit [Desulfohalobiaceae bacterium Ax17]|uniref:hydrogenase large subunit n=1 Tax=Desulfovulcanus ferrireducens TaxID=2831190 RepID=UPI00207BAA74|nr:nickel-dependent hydrogenase large subunit [Desulfovulcanus ferrireducens]MBT8762825.1 nickel-dependent hydrogenase large subunit [Desulfovulcanus ferrireducens]
MSTFTIPVGPLHVALEEPMYFKVEVEGETVVSLDITAGHVHRGMELLAMNRNFYQNITLTERLCSLCSNSHPCTYCMALEKIAGIQVPERGEYLRVIADEIKRMGSNLFNAGILAHIIGFESLFMHAMEIREIVQDIKETIYGNRMNLAANCIGGVRYDLTTEKVKYITKQLECLKKSLDELYDIYTKNKFVRARTEGVGVLPKEAAIHYGVVGPVARGSGIDYDVRKKSPYAAYDRLKFDVPVEEGCDVRARVMVRLREIFEAIKIVEQCLKDLPHGPTCIDYLPEIPAGEAVAKSEAPRGELIYYLRTNGTDTPERLKWRVPTYMNWEALHVMMPGNKVSDIPLIINSIDPCISCTER